MTRNSALFFSLLEVTLPSPEQVLSAASNILGLAVASRCWSSELLTQNYPEHLSTEGVLNLQLWGVAYLAAAHSLNWNRHPQPWIFVVLVLHKVFCTATWVWWLLYKQKPVAVPPWDADLEQIWGKDPIVALFFATYGAADFGFACIFFQAAELGFAAPPPPRKRRTTPTSKETALRTLVYLGAFPSSVLLPGWVLTAWEGGGILKSYYPEVLSHEGVAAIALWGLLSVAAAQSLGGAQPQPWLFAALCLSHLFYFSCWASLLFVQQGLTDFKFLVVARPVVGLFFGGAGIHSLFCATIAAVCWMACLKRERQLQMKRNRRRTSAGESIDSALATVSTGVVQEQHQQQLRHRANQAVHPTE